MFITLYYYLLDCIPHSEEANQFLEETLPKCITGYYFCFAIAIPVAIFTVFTVLDIIFGTKEGAVLKVLKCKENVMPLSQGQTTWDCYVEVPLPVEVSPSEETPQPPIIGTWVTSYDKVDVDSEISIVFRRGRYTGWMYGVQLGNIDDELPIPDDIEPAIIRCVSIVESKFPLEPEKFKRVRKPATRKSPPRAASKTKKNKVPSLAEIIADE